MIRAIFTLLLFLCVTGCSNGTQDFDSGYQQADLDLEEGAPVVVDYYGAPGNNRLDGTFGLLVQGCEAPQGRLLEALDSGARGGAEIYDAIIGQTPDLAEYLENRIDDAVWPSDHSPALVECYAADPEYEPQMCAWLLLSRNAPEASKAWVAGYNYGVLKRIAKNTRCESLLRLNPKELINEF